MKEDLAHLPRELADQFTGPFLRFVRIEAMAGAILLLCVVVALSLANSAWSSQYFALWEIRVGLSLGNIEFSRSLQHWINDGLMTLFFLGAVKSPPVGSPATVRTRGTAFWWDGFEVAHRDRRKRNRARVGVRMAAARQPSHSVNEHANVPIEAVGSRFTDRRSAEHRQSEFVSKEARNDRTELQSLEQ
ncbi:Na+/H+ antiporter NhaA [Cupriavidus sp. RAF12]|uniref:Na+/H+ antiporter NhaA n=1 Tax=Cupriavidus sp. RAF12 TaxID=3233050 RepID=UPI003F8ED579